MNDVRTLKLHRLHQKFLSFLNQRLLLACDTGDLTWHENPETKKWPMQCVGRSVRPTDLETFPTMTRFFSLKCPLPPQLLLGVTFGVTFGGTCQECVNTIHHRTALNIKLLEPLAQGASIFEKLLAPLKIHWPPIFSNDVRVKPSST